MGDISTEPSMEEILSSIKRIISEEGDAGSVPARARRPGRPVREVMAADDEVLELRDAVPGPRLAEPAPQRSEPAEPAADAILSPRAAEASRGALEALSRVVEKPQATPANPGAAAGETSLEGLVREMLRPMLSAWLDANLPQIVEAMVAREIERITHRAD